MDAMFLVPDSQKSIDRQLIKLLTSVSYSTLDLAGGLGSHAPCGPAREGFG
jgi:hypothetical protein